MKDFRKTKIIGTIGPASESEEMLTKLMNAGLNVCRINFSHGGYEENAEKIAQMRSHTPIGLAVAFYLIFIVIIFYLLSSPAFISHQHCSIYHQQWLSLNQQMASLSQ